jgi:hypothetical protein
MLMFIDDVLVHAHIEPVVPGQFRLEYSEETNRVTLWHGTEQVESGMRFYGTKAKVDPKTGQILSLDSKFNKIRAVFANQHLEITLDTAAQDPAGAA